ncbi:MAG: YoaK family protein [Acidimicrobiales bacterium]
MATPREIWLGLTNDPDHGPLAGILTMLTVIAGLVDATSLLRLDRVFVANVTGSVIFIGLALVGARGFSLAAPLIALATFLIGAGLGVRVFARHVAHRGRSAYAACLAQFTDLLAASVIVLFDHHPTDPVRLTLVGILALGMGAKSALVRSVNVPGLTTAVVTTTLTGLASEGATGTWRSTNFAIRLIATCALLVGAVIGGALVIFVERWTALAAADVRALAALVWARSTARSNESWTIPKG